MKNIKHLLLIPICLIVAFTTFRYLISAPFSIAQIREQYPELIGRGGYGEIRSDGSSMVIKLSKRESKCLDYKKEFNTQLQIYNAFKNMTHPNAFLKRATILEPYKFEEGSEGCFYFMTRLAPISADATLLDQLYLGEPSFDKKFANDNFIRGHYIGLEQTKRKIDGFPEDSQLSNINQLHYNFGRLLGIVTLAAKYDVRDFELVLSKNNNDYKIALIDFDQMSSIADLFKGYKEENILKITKELERSFESEPYLPEKESVHFTYFKKGYMDLAKELDEQQNTDFYSKAAKEIMEIDW